MFKSFVKAIVSIAFCMFVFGCNSDFLPYGENRISGPYTAGNLNIFLIHGKDIYDAANLLTLDEAVAAKKILVHETGSVNELDVENISDQPVFIQAGDIVKGGRQDRTLQDDAVVPPKSGKVPVKSFCVESGRWSQRNNEAAASFGSAKKQLASRELKLAARAAKSQGQVWDNVAKVQEKLGTKMGRTVQSAASQSSLQLTLENSDVTRTTKQYIDSILQKTEGRKEVIGFAYAINGEMSAMDMYGCTALFKKQWPRMLEAAATEAICESDSDQTQLRPTLDQAVAWAQAAEKPRAETETVNSDNDVMKKESEGAIQFEAYSKQQPGKCVHKTVLKKSAIQKDNSPVLQHQNIR